MRCKTRARYPAREGIPPKGAAAGAKESEHSARPSNRAKGEIEAMSETCVKKTHQWDSTGRICLICGARRTRMPKVRPLVTGKVPELIPLRFGQVYCELCATTINAGDRVAWWRVLAGKKSRPAAYCPDCHRSNVRQGKALRPCLYP
jgi:hypothetical protein